MKFPTILLIEDDPNDEELILRTFRNSGLADDIAVAHNGQEALELLFHGKPDEGLDVSDLPRLILLDLKLPKMGGLEVLQALRVHNRTRMVPVVVFTSSMEKTDVLASYDLGANSYVRKPVDYEDFTSVLKQIVSYWLGINVPLSRDQ